MSGHALLQALRRGLSAARDFLRGFTGLPAPHLHAGELRDAAASRKALEARAERRRSCC